MSLFYKGKKALVTGGTGTIGTAAVKRLVALGADVTVASIDNMERVKAVLDDPSIFRWADLRDYKTCLDVAKGQEVIVEGECYCGEHNSQKQHGKQDPKKRNPGSSQSQHLVVRREPAHRHECAHESTEGQSVSDDDGNRVKDKKDHVEERNFFCQYPLSHEQQLINEEDEEKEQKQEQQRPEVHGGLDVSSRRRALRPRAHRSCWLPEDKGTGFFQLRGPKSTAKHSQRVTLFERRRKRITAPGRGLPG